MIKYYQILLFIFLPSVFLSCKNQVQFNDKGNKNEKSGICIWENKTNVECNEFARRNDEEIDFILSSPIASIGRKINVPLLCYFFENKINYCSINNSFVLRCRIDFNDYKEMMTIDKQEYLVYVEKNIDTKHIEYLLKGENNIDSKCKSVKINCAKLKVCGFEIEDAISKEPFHPKQRPVFVFDYEI